MKYKKLNQKVFKLVFVEFSKILQEKYGITVSQATLRLSVTGDFDGTHIIVRKDLDIETKLFILIHLFGHTVQFNISKEMRNVGLAQFGPDNVSEKILKKINIYETNASRYGLWALHKNNIYYLDQWLSNWQDGDGKYLEWLYTTGKEELLNKKFLKEYKKKYIISGAPLLISLKVPKFVPKKYESRSSF